MLVDSGVGFGRINGGFGGKWISWAGAKKSAVIVVVLVASVPADKVITVVRVGSSGECGGIVGGLGGIADGGGIDVLGSKDGIDIRVDSEIGLNIDWPELH